MGEQHQLNEAVHIPARIGTGFGFVIVLLGLLCILAPFVTGIAVTTMIAISVIAAGSVMAVYAFKAGSFGRGALQLLFGGITIIAGVTLLTTPIFGLFALTTVLIAWFLVDGVYSIIAGIRGKNNPGWIWVIVSGVASILLAILLFQQWPDSGTYAVGLLVGIRLIFTGWSVAMLGMLADGAVDVVEEATKEAATSQEKPKG